MNAEARVRALLEAPKDGWIAFSEDEERVVAYGATYAEAVEKAERLGIADPVLVKIPDQWTPVVRGV